MPKPSKADERNPYTLEDMKLARAHFVALHATPKTALLLSRFANVLMAMGIVVVLMIHWRQQVDFKRTLPIVVRVNDVGRAEAVRVDEMYIPEEPEVVNSLELLVMRMFSRNPFTLPEAIELNGIYLTGDGLERWVKQAREDLAKAATGNGLKRVRILQCRLENLGQARASSGARAFIRYALDDCDQTGAYRPGTSTGHEIALEFMLGDYVKTTDNDLRQAWVRRNPLGVKVLRYQVTRYQGADVELADPSQADSGVRRLPGPTESYAPGAQKAGFTEPTAN